MLGARRARSRCFWIGYQADGVTRLRHSPYNLKRGTPFAHISVTGPRGERVLNVPVQLGPRSYRIVVEVGALDRVGPLLADLDVGRRAALISDPAVARLHGERVVASLSVAGFSVTPVKVPEGEAAKTLAVAEASWDALLTAGLDRSSTVLALGGGAVGDVAGFVAATYMRGINFVQIPTTVLAQVDASIGGKTAIDHPRAKNVVGAFHQPRLVVTDPDIVRTLPDREFRSGLAEMVKHGVVLDASYFAELEREAPALCVRDLPALESAIAGSCRLKAGVVERDEREAELRAALNYGHTIGHALEAATSFGRWTHGEAVALGHDRRGSARRATRGRQERDRLAAGTPPDRPRSPGARHDRERGGSPAGDRPRQEGSRTITDGFDADFGVDEWHGTNAFIRDGDTRVPHLLHQQPRRRGVGRYVELPRHDRLGTPGAVGGLTGGLPADRALRVVELARRIR